MEIPTLSLPKIEIAIWVIKKTLQMHLFLFLLQTSQFTCLFLILDYQPFITNLLKMFARSIKLYRYSLELTLVINHCHRSQYNRKWWQIRKNLRSDQANSNTTKRYCGHQNQFQHTTYSLRMNPMVVLLKLKSWQTQLAKPYYFN